MNSKFKTAAIAAIASGVLAGAMFASAQTAVTTSITDACFTQNMRLGTTNSEVIRLQQVLNTKGFTVSTTGVGSAGMESNYFGAKTRAAVIKFQAANGVPATGNVFNLTRAALNAACKDVVSVNPTNPTTPVVAGPVSVALAASQPNNVLVAGSVNATLANFNFTGNGTINQLRLMRNGVSNNTTLANVYLYDTNTGARLTDAASVLTDGTVTFTSGFGLFTVAGSRAITVKADISRCNDGSNSTTTCTTTSGQSVGVSLVGITTLGNPMAMITGVTGPALPIGSADIVSVSLQSTTTVSTTVDAGRQNVVFWEGTVNTSKDSYMSGALFSFTGSAPYSVFANLKLYVNGVQTGNAAMIDANGKVSFANGSQFLRSGTHTISLRGDVTGGAGRDYYVRLEDAGLSFEDANIRGVYGALTGFTTTNTKTATVNINSCSSTNCSIYSVDGTFSGQRVIAGASQQTIGKYTFRAVGESVKLVSGTLSITGATNTGDIRNVSVWVDGTQVVSGRTLALSGTSVALSNLGGVVINMGTTSVIEIKADVSSSTGIALTSNTLTARLALDVQGQDSRNSTSFGTVAANSVTVGALNATFTNNSNFTGSKVGGNQSNVKVGSYTLSTGNEAVRLTGINVTFTPATMNLSSVTNFRLMDGSNQVYNQSNVGSGSSASTVNSSAFIEIPANSSKTFDVLVDFNNAANNTSVSVTAAATYQGLVSLSNKTDTITTGQVTTVSTPGLQKIAKAASSLSDRYVVNGTVNNAAVFTLTATGTSFTATKMQVTVSNPAAVGAVTIAGVNAINRGNGIWTADVNTSISTIGTDVPVSVTFNTANRDTNTLSGATTSIALSYVFGSTGSTNVTVGTEDTANATGAAALDATKGLSSTFTVVGAYPTLRMTNNTNTVSPGTFSNTNLGTVTITPVGGTVSVTAFGVNLPTGITSARIVDSTGNVVTNATLSGQTAGPQTVTISPVSNISSAVTYTLQGSGNNSGTVSTVMGASLGAVNTVTWNDVTGSTATAAITGSNLLPNYNN